MNTAKKKPKDKMKLGEFLHTPTVLPSGNKRARSVRFVLANNSEQCTHFIHIRTAQKIIAITIELQISILFH